MTETKKYKDNYWETETGELIEFGKSFMRCYDKAGKLQFGKIINSSGEKKYVVKFVIDRKELFGSKEGVDYLKGTLDAWKEIYEEELN